MASNRDRPEVPWGESRPAFHVKLSDPDAERASGQFTKRKVVYLGSDEGCGCGFQREHDWLSADPKERESKRENQRRLADYLMTCLEDEESVELFGCWSGDEQEARVREREIDVTELLEERFFFIEKERILVKKKQNQIPLPMSPSRLHGTS